MQADMEKDLWPLSWRHGVFIYNRMPHSGLDWKSPFEMFYGKCPDLTNVRIFGSSGTSHIDKTLRKKNEQHAWSGIYVGNAEDAATTFLMFNPIKNDVQSVGQIKLVENSPELSRVISNPYTQKIYYEEPDFTIPEPPDKDSFVNDRNARVDNLIEIQDHRVYYDVKNKDHHALVKINTSRKIVKWFFLSALLATDVKYFSSVHKYLTTKYSAGSFSANEHYPLFSGVDYTADDTSVLPGFVTCVDTYDLELPYQLAVQDEQSPDGVSIMDCGPERLGSFSEGIACNAMAGDVTNQYSNYVAPVSYAQSKRYPDFVKWKDCTERELNSMDVLKVFEVVSDKDKIPSNATVLSSRFVYKLKRLSDGTIDKYKCRLVVKGYRARQGKDYDETFAPVTQLTTIKTGVSLGLQHRLKAEKGDVGTAFLNSDIKYEVYVKLPEGVQFKGSSIVKLGKSIYGLPQAGADWNENIDQYILESDSRFKRSKVDPCLYYIWEGSTKILLLLYVDDIVLFHNDQKWADKFWKSMEGKYTVTLDEDFNYICGVKVQYDVVNGQCLFSQKREIADLITKYRVGKNDKSSTPMTAGFDFREVEDENHVNPDVPFRSLLGSLLWLCRNSRPDISPAVSIISRYTARHSMYHWRCLITILQYLNATQDDCLSYKSLTTRELHAMSSDLCKLESSPEFNVDTSNSTRKDKKVHNMETFVPIVTFVDSDWATCKVTRRSMTGYCTFLYGNMVNWTSCRQDVVAGSSVEAEYMAAGTAIKDGLYLSNLLSEIFGEDKLEPAHMHSDSKGAIHIALNEVNNSRTKHIDIRHHRIRELIKSGRIYLHKVMGTNNPADHFTKPLGKTIFSKYGPQICMRSFDAVSSVK
jgi:hypothetical protein